MSTETTTQSEYINIGQLSSYLGWSPRFIEGLVRGEHLPGLEVQGQCVFRRDDVVDWLEQKIQTLDTARVTELEAKMESSLLADGTFRTTRTDRLTSRLPLKGIALDVPAANKTEVLHAIATTAEATGLLFDREHLLTSLVDRESLCSTAMPGGVALCHPRRPIPSIIERQFLCLVRTSAPVDFGAEDQEGTSLFFLLATPDDRSHLHGLARLARILQGGTLDALKAAATSEDILAALAEAESRIQIKD
ncbi:PTS sugar transporter subunit IIA [Luteolibacter yonseiensis]|uniref:PTS sugar transporter subunit IIA n=1 Tax=Luteolibacter yonseiensis TaxID=1144680 RepID=A0A934QZP1_9BACT|nr:PTS sugar transporter subunit IIA [Luteolibacter yonseiensis]MBK1814034.1 PTS sugar transporter subunit IIA [Luteolibacter yonseiensis]